MSLSSTRARWAALLSLFALVALGACPSKPPKPTDKLGKGGKALKPRALRKRLGLRELLERVEAPREQSRRDAVAVAARGLRRPLAYLDLALTLARKTPAGRVMVAEVERKLKRDKVLSELSARGLEQSLKRWGVDVDGPLALVAQGRRLRGYLSIHDPKAFRAAIVKLARFGKLLAKWHPPTDDDPDWQLVAASGAASAPVLSCRFDSLRAVSCAARTYQDRDPLTPPKPQDSLWARVRAGQRKRLTAGAGQGADALAMLFSRAAHVSSVLTLGKGALTAELEASGGETAKWAQLLRRTSAAGLFSAQRAGSGEQLYVRLPLAPFVRKLRGLPIQRWASGELLLRPGGKCKLPVLLLGSNDPKATEQALGALSLLLRLSKSVVVRARRASGQTVIVLDNPPAKARPGRPALLPVALALTVTPAGLLVAPEPCLAEAAAAARKPIPRVHHKPSEAPFAVGKLRLGDLLAALDAKTRAQLTTLGGPAVQQLMPVVRALIGALKQVSLRLRAPTADRVQAKISVIHGDGAQTGMLAAAFALVTKTLLVPAMTRYRLKVSTIEATEGLDKLKVGAKAFFMADHYDRSGKLLPKAFPPSSKGWTPKVPCCKQRGQRCQPSAKAWNAPTWRSLQFQLTDPHRYQYRFISKGKGKRATFVIEARGDLDCDGVYSSYKLLGKVDQDFGVRSIGPIIRNELE